jgi:putative protease
MGVKERLSKMGGTYLSLSPEDIELSLSEGVNLSPSAINGLRRAAVEKFLDFKRAPVLASEELPKKMDKGGEKALTAEFYSPEKYSEARARYPELISKIDIAFLPMGADGEAILSAGGVILPAVITDGETAAAKERLSELSSLGVRAALVQNIGQISLARECGFETLYGGFRLNITNGKAKSTYLDLGVDNLILSPELTLPKARDISGGVITYGRIPLMLTERCFMREGFGCSSCGEAALTDRRGERFPMIREFSHRNIILNSVPTYLGDRTKELTANRITSRHLLFTVERGDEIVRILKAHKQSAPLEGGKVRRAGRR